MSNLEKDYKDNTNYNFAVSMDYEGSFSYIYKPKIEKFINNHVSETLPDFRNIETESWKGEFKINHLREYGVTKKNGIIRGVFIHEGERSVLDMFIDSEMWIEYENRSITPDKKVVEAYEDLRRLATDLDEEGKIMKRKININDDRTDYLFFTQYTDTFRMSQKDKGNKKYIGVISIIKTIKIKENK